MNYLLALLTLFVLIGGYFAFRRYMKQHEIKELSAFKDGHLALGKAIFYATHKDELYALYPSIIEWEYNYEGKIEMGFFKKLTDDLKKEYSDKLRLLTDDR